MSTFARSRVTAVLGPTNTGKTHLAIERMLGHASGVIGFPLRLLARENYDRIVRIKGTGQVALVTGEEKIIPPHARYFCCTVESMPIDRSFEFLAVDEIQLCADPERGHVFTDRLLHARGLEETMFLGAETIRPLVRQLVPDAEHISRPRLSTLSYTGPRKMTRLAPRTAVVAFSVSEVYATAELLRRQRGGTAVILGALSPRTRNAQVGMFECGEVDYLVATDAIGMGLNLTLDHVALAALAKFDGRGRRHLTAPEIGQIAGRAGRHMSDGTFGTTGPLNALDEEIVAAVESHQFESLQTLFWRNRKLRFNNLASLLHSLEQRPPDPMLLRVRDADDHLALNTLSRDSRIAELAATPDAVHLLWEVCRIPDFRKTLSEQHTGLLSRIYRHLMARDGRLPEDWVAGHLTRLESSDGDIDQLIARLAHIRTWTYVTHRPDWLEDTAHWQGRTRAIEDRLSDALHDRLTQRFVDRRTAVLVRRLRDGGDLLAAVRANGEVLVEGEFVGRLEGFRFLLDTTVDGEEAKPLLTAARRALRKEMPRRIKQLEDDNDGAFTLSQGQIAWRGYPVARLTSSDWILSPAVEPLRSDFLDGPSRERIRLRLWQWLDRHIRTQLKPLFRLQGLDLSGAAKGLVFQVVESLGAVPRAQVESQIAALGRADRKLLANNGLRIGVHNVFLPGLQNSRATHVRAQLWAAQTRRPIPEIPEALPASFRPTAQQGVVCCLALGYQRLTRRSAPALAVRVDVLERVAQAAYRLSKAGSLGIDNGLMSQAGVDEGGLRTILIALDYRPDSSGEQIRYSRVRRWPKGKDRKSKKRQNTQAKSRTLQNADSPFAVLGQLVGKVPVRAKPVRGKRSRHRGRSHETE